MGRSVSVPTGAAWVAYLNIMDMGIEDSWEFDEFVVNEIRAAIQARYPSFDDADYFVGREDRVVMHNGHGKIGVSEYCGLMSVWGLPDSGDYADLAEDWFFRNEDGMQAAVEERFSGAALRSMGRFSNGEQVFRPVERPEGVVSSKEGTLW